MVVFRDLVEKHTLKRVHIKFKNGEIFSHNLALLGNYEQVIEDVSGFNSKDIEVGVIHINAHGKESKQNKCIFFNKERYLEVPIRNYLQMVDADKLQKRNPENSYIENILIVAAEHLNGKKES